MPLPDPPAPSPRVAGELAAHLVSLRHRMVRLEQEADRLGPPDRLPLLRRVIELDDELLLLELLVGDHTTETRRLERTLGRIELEAAELEARLRPHDQGAERCPPEATAAGRSAA